jgi:hypothetical protein
VPEPAADSGRHLGSGRRRRRLPRLLPLVAARPRGDLACAPPAVTRVIAAGILTVAGVPVLEEDVPAGQNQTRPPMYEMGGLVRHRHARSGQLPGFAGVTRRPPVPSIRARPGFPAPPTFPGSPPRWCPFPTVRAFLLPPRTPRKSPRSIISDFSAIHTVSTERMQLSAPDGDYPPANSQAIHKSPCVAPGTPDPVASCNRPILSLQLSG